MITKATRIPPSLEVKRICLGEYQVFLDSKCFEIYRHDDNQWYVYKDGDCLWVDQRFKDCKQWVQKGETA